MLFLQITYDFDIDPIGAVIRLYVKARGSMPYDPSSTAVPGVAFRRMLPFDLTTFKYVPISQAAEIPNKVKTEIVAILRDTGAPI